MATKANRETVPADIVPNRISDDELSGIKSFDDAMALAEQYHGSVLPADEVLGNGFAVISDKSVLIGVPMILLQWRMNDGDQGTFVSVSAVARTEMGMKKVIINDGSTGIRDQLAKYSQKTGRDGGLVVKKGLRRSDYDVTMDDGSVKHATTFYLDTSA